MLFSLFTLQLHLLGFLNFYYMDANLCAWNQINWVCIDVFEIHLKLKLSLNGHLV